MRGVCVVNTGGGGVGMVVSPQGGTGGRMPKGQSTRALPKGGLLRSGGGGGGAGSGRGGVWHGRKRCRCVACLAPSLCVALSRSRSLCVALCPSIASPSPSLVPLVFGLWRVCFPPCLVRPGRRLPVQGLSEGSLGYRDRLPA